MADVTVIASEIDGAELKREKKRNRQYLRCDGEGDQHEIQEALDRSNKSATWAGLGDAWERIFGKR